MTVHLSTIAVADSRIGIQSNIVLRTKCLKTNHEGTKQAPELKSPLRDFVSSWFNCWSEAHVNAT